MQSARFDSSEKENAVAGWVFSRRMPAGKFTESLSRFRGATHTVTGPHSGHGRALGAATGGPAFRPDREEIYSKLSRCLSVWCLRKTISSKPSERAEILEASENLRRALLQSVSHELKTPLSAIQAGTDAIARQSGGDEKSQRTVREIQVAVRRLHRVINNLLNMTRIESGIIQPKLDWF